MEYIWSPNRNHPNYRRHMVSETVHHRHPLLRRKAIICSLIKLDVVTDWTRKCQRHMSHTHSQSPEKNFPRSPPHSAMPTTQNIAKKIIYIASPYDLRFRFEEKKWFFFMAHFFLCCCRSNMLSILIHLFRFFFFYSVPVSVYTFISHSWRVGKYGSLIQHILRTKIWKLSLLQLRCSMFVHTEQLFDEYYVFFILRFFLSI